ncbi:alpha/beta hydrolase [Sphingobacterium paludis]|uniref:Acetyl esterase/lipase n=1 Tax=Sphingobacterium paludis TaxID=1476465 RepID=A0A4R7DBU2_9SPHI|nr:alpha/beta hydrolase [Sphingobacterium paludis]TDS17751.1 acetyl esterase/lipase [Sphingobacterium paludis]
MKKSFGYYLVRFVLKLKGLKAIFSTSPVDYRKLRKSDVLLPPRSLFNSARISMLNVLKTVIVEITPVENSADRLLIYLHGGAFISGPAQHHWDSLKKIGNATHMTLWTCRYPRGPESQIDEISANIDEVYQLALTRFNPTAIVIAGDSAGATLAMALIQRLRAKQIAIPKKLVLISPVADAAFTNPEIKEVERKDVMLAKTGVLSAKQMVAVDGDLNDQNLSPLYGSFDGFPETLFFAATNDITYPDQKLLIEKMKNAQVQYKLIIGEDMPHIWPLLPIMRESRVALADMISFLKQ